MFIVGCVFLICVLVCLWLGLLKVYKKGLHRWIFSDIRRGVSKRIRTGQSRPIHLMFAIVDHFEPGNLGVDMPQQIRRVDEWVLRYPEMALKHKDSDGVCPQHTFFFPPHYDSDRHLEKIVQLCSKGFGEVEMHLHHDRHGPWPDDEASLRQKLLDCIESFSRFGVFCLSNGEKRYAFIHGDWALANSLKDGEHCGINDELSILAETGCYADFTFPSGNEAQPKLANTIFYAQSSRNYPKGYDKLFSEIEVGKRQQGGLLCIQGILGLRWRSRTHRFYPSIEQSNINKSDFPFDKRIDYWVDKAIHVQGKPDWKFMKMHTHGAREREWDTLLGRPRDDMHSYLESKYNDGVNYVLHYVTAREMYNIVKAAEDGRDGNPNSYRDFLIPRYIYTPNRP